MATILVFSWESTDRISLSAHSYTFIPVFVFVRPLPRPTRRRPRRAPLFVVGLCDSLNMVFSRIKVGPWDFLLRFCTPFYIGRWQWHELLRLKHLCSVRYSIVVFPRYQLAIEARPIKSAPMPPAGSKLQLAEPPEARDNIISTVWVKKSIHLKLFAVFSLLINLCNWKLSWLLPRHIPMSTPILVHLSENLCEMYHFYRCDSSNFKNSV